MNNAGLRGFVPGSKRFIQKSLSGFRIFGRDSRFHLAGQRPNFASDLEVMLGVGIRLTMRFERGCVTSCL